MSLASNNHGRENTEDYHLLPGLAENATTPFSAHICASDLANRIFANIDCEYPSRE
jgi:hypothetical protein